MPEMTTSWTVTNWSQSNWSTKSELKDIYNVEEFDLFHQALPGNSLHYKGERCSGGKHNKVRMTGLAAVNAMGEKLPMFVMGKSAKPCCFGGVKSLPCAQKHTWMEEDFFIK